MSDFLSFSDYVRQKFGCKVYKLPLDAGFTCPNRKDDRTEGGCIYCRNDAFKPYFISSNDSLEKQLAAGRRMFSRRDIDTFFAYFQAYTSTYAEIGQLRRLYSRALLSPGVIGLCVGTRPDCLSEEVIDLLAGFARSGSEVWIEIGQQTAHDETLKRINRGHDFAAYRRTVDRIQKHSALNLCMHLIFGLPGEDRSMMLETVEKITNLGVDGVKFHQLQVLTETPLAAQYQSGDYQPIAYETYRGILQAALEILPEDVVVQRLMAEAPDSLLLAPRWSKTKHELRRELTGK